MARIRSIKPDFFLHEGLAELSPLHRVFFIGLWTLADKEGRLEDRPKRIKAALLPWEDVDVDELLADLAARGFIVRYEAAGIACIEIPGFSKHQRPHPKEQAYGLPRPDEAARQPSPRRFVYFIQAGGGPIKIGTAINPTSRLDALQTAHPDELRLIGVVPAERFSERELHARFADSRRRGEWFAPSDALRVFISRECSEHQDCISPPALKPIPSCPPGKGREGDLGHRKEILEVEAETAGAGPPPPVLKLEPSPSQPPPRKRSEAQEFWDHFQAQRTELHGLVRESEPEPQRLNAWLVLVAKEGVTLERLWDGAALYLGSPRDPHWAAKGYPFAGFASGNVWRSYVPAKVAS